jgi:HK97 family phage prohead protease
MEKDIRHLYAYIAEKSADEKAAPPINEDDHSVNFVISSNKMDRHDEIVEVQAIADSIPGFAKNPVALACHLHRLSDGKPPVIGSWDTDSFKAFKSYSQMRLNFAVDTELGKEYWNLYSKKHMRAVSIGFRILDGHEEVKDSKRFYIITKIELYEISAVAVGANREALSKSEFYRRNIEDDAGEVKRVEELEERIAKVMSERLDTIEESLDEIKTLLIADQDGLADKLLLGGKSDTSDPAGDDNLSERILSTINKALQEAIKQT